MSSTNPAAQALVEALKDPSLQPAQRQALLDALQALHGPVVGASNQGAATGATPATRLKRKVERRADTVRLSREAIAAMTLPATGERYVYDTVVPQLAVRLRPGGKSLVLVTWDRERRRTVKHTLGKVESLTPEQARKQAQQLVARVADGEDVRRPAVESLTLAELIAMWHEEKKHGVRTAGELRDKALAYLGKLAHRRASEVTRADLGAIHHEIATKGRRRVWKRIGNELQAVEVGPVGIPGTADKWVDCIRMVYGWGITKGLIDGENPAAKIQRAYDSKGRARTRYLHGDELARFWSALDAEDDTDARDAILLMLLTGQRRGNVLAMAWQDIDIDGGAWTVPASATKQRKAQSTPLVAQARVILVRRLQSASGSWVFPAVRASKDGEVGPMSETRVREAWTRICASAGITDLRIHDARHTAGSWLARLNTDVAIRQRALGHHDARTAARYAHLALDPVQDAMQRAADAIESEAKRKPAASMRRLRG